jgi:hypothetical protein
MPKCFKYKDAYENKDHEEIEPEFRCFLKSKQCTAFTKRQGLRCQNMSVIGLPYCYAHAKTELNIVIKPSTRVNRDGKGVFAYHPKVPRGLVFRENDVIFEFVGQKRTKTQMVSRYGDLDIVTPPYAIRISETLYIDAACERGVASMINHGAGDAANVNMKARRRRGQEPVIVVFAKRNIYDGTELLADWAYLQAFDGYRVAPGTHKTYDCRYSRTWDRYYHYR